MVFYQIAVLKTFVKPTGKHLCHSLTFKKVSGDATGNPGTGIFQEISQNL